MSPSAVILAGQSTNPDFDIAQLQSVATVRENSFSGRLDVKLSPAWSSYVRVFHDQGTSDQNEGVSGRVVHITDNPTNAVFNLQGVLSDHSVNEFKFGYNSAPSNIIGQAPIVNGIDFSKIAINLSGISGEQRHRRPGIDDRPRHPRRSGARQQRDQRPRRSPTTRTR